MAHGPGGLLGAQWCYTGARRTGHCGALGSPVEVEDEEDDKANL
jgi:hypothetical protein